jgi:imidazolonepropionase-like amidohydrolase
VGKVESAQPSVHVTSTETSDRGTSTAVDEDVDPGREARVVREQEVHNRRELVEATAAGVKIACGTDAPAIPHRDNAKELRAMVDRGMIRPQTSR